VSLKRLTPYIYTGIETTTQVINNNLFQLLFQAQTFSGNSVNYLFEQINPSSINDPLLLRLISTLSAKYQIYQISLSGQNILNLTNDEISFLNQVAVSFSTNIQLPSMIQTTKTWLQFAYLHWSFLKTNQPTISQFYIQTTDSLANYIMYVSLYNQEQYLLDNYQIALS
jgi:hypothetical protein